MKLSTKGRYGVRLMLDLAMYSGGGPVFLKDIASRQNISQKYLWHLIPPLKNAGLITSHRGSHGGYLLAKPAEQITLKDVVSVLEGPMCLVDCVDNPRLCRRSANCISRDIWKEASDKMLEILGSFTLAGMVEKQKSKSRTLNYII
jgi:Rrf2 family protein